MSPYFIASLPFHIFPYILFLSLSITNYASLRYYHEIEMFLQDIEMQTFLDNVDQGMFGADDTDFEEENSWDGNEDQGYDDGQVDGHHHHHCHYHQHILYYHHDDRVTDREMTMVLWMQPSYHLPLRP